MFIKETFHIEISLKFDSFKNEIHRMDQIWSKV